MPLSWKKLINEAHQISLKEQSSNQKFKIQILVELNENEEYDEGTVESFLKKYIEDSRLKIKVLNINVREAF